MRALPKPSGTRAALFLVCLLISVGMGCAVSTNAGLLCMVGEGILIGSLMLVSPNYRKQMLADFDALFGADPAPSVGALDRGETSDFIRTFNNPAYRPSFWELPRVYTIRLPKDQRWSSPQAATLMTKLQHLGKLILRIQATPQAMLWQLIDVNDHPFGADEVSRAIRSAYVDADVSDPICLEKMDGTKGHWRRVDYYHPSQEWLRPSLRVEDIKKDDPLTAIVNGLIDLREGERVSYLVAFGMDDNVAANEALLQQGYESVTTSKTTAVALSVLSAALSEHSLSEGVGAGIGQGIYGIMKGGRPDKYPPDVMKACAEKINLFPCVRGFVMVEANSPNRERLNQFNFYLPFVTAFSSHFQALTATQEPETQVNTERDEQRTNGVYVLTRLLHSPLLPLDARANILVGSELAALWHLPHDQMTASEIVWLKGRQMAAPLAFRGERAGVLLGTNKATKAAIYQPLSERIVHTLIIGKTGTGKTSFMQALVEQDIRAGNGVAVIDPMGGMVKRILQHGIPPEREGDVVVLDIGFTFDEKGTYYPPPLNPLAKSQGVAARKSAGDFAAVLTKLYSDTSQTRWMQTIQAILELLTIEDHATLYDLEKVLDDRVYRNDLIARFKDFNVTQRWERIERGGGLTETSVRSVLWRLGDFLNVEAARASTCHPNKIDFVSLMKENKIILVSVQADEGLVPKSAQNAIGALILSQIQLAALSNAVAEPKTRPFILYVDEVQDFATASLDEIARQARQKGLGLVVATQDTSTIAPATLRALKGNLGTLVAFECNADDAQNALDMMPGFTVSDLMNLGRYQTIISMRSEDGATRAAFNVDPVHGEDISTDAAILARERLIRHRSVATHTPMAYDEVDAWLSARYDSTASNGDKTQDNGNDYGNPLI